MGTKVIVIVGPTCSGKTKLSLMLAHRLNAEIISADSRQIYKYLNIGTAKPRPADLHKVKHHFIDMLEPDKNYNASRFEVEALQVIENLTAHNKVPIVVGGSGLYVKALLDGIFSSVDTDEEYRNDLLEQRKKSGNEYLYNELKKVDPESASKMLPQNWKRVMRALEVFHISGKPISVVQNEYVRKNNFEFVQFGLNWDRSALYSNIEARVDKMILSGLIQETRRALEKGFDRSLNSLNTVGYKEIIAYLNNEIEYDKAIELIKRNTRRYAKRQLTWFKRDDRVTWFDIKPQWRQLDTKEDLEKAADEIIRREKLNEA